MPKRYKWSFTLLGIASAFGIWGWFAKSLPIAMVGVCILCFIFGFVVALDKIFKTATGRELTDDNEVDEILEKIL